MTSSTANNDEDWEDESIEYLVAEMGSFDTTAKELEQQAELYQGCDIVGLETDTPFVRIGHLVFKGSYERLLGTDVVFGMTEKTTSSNRSVNLNYMGHSSKKLVLEPVKLVPKSSSSHTSQMDTNQ